MWHYLRPNVSTSQPVNVYYLDTESRVLRESGGIQWQTFRLGVSCYAVRRDTSAHWTYTWTDWTDADALVRDIAAKAQSRRTVYVVCSNPVYDFWCLDAYRRLHDLGFRLRFFYDKGLVHILKAVRTRATITVIAIQNYFPVSVRQIGQWLGFPKLDANPLTCPLPELWDYCRRDVDVIRLGFESWLEFVADADMGGFSLTMSSQAMRAFRHRFMRDRILIHSQEQVKDWERQAYFGGRTECFRLGTFKRGPYWVLDVNSMYPHVMKQTPLPIRLLNVVSRPKMAYLRASTARACVVAHIRVRDRKTALAVRTDDGIIFPKGPGWCWVCTPGMRYALDHCEVLECDALAVYRPAVIFREFVDCFYDRRRAFESEGNVVWGQICKYILNRCYGKFAERAPLVIEDRDCHDGQLSRETVLNLDSGNTYTLTRLMGREWIESGSEDGKNSAVAISAHITEAARLHLWGLVNRMTRGRVLYCDTDSIMIHERDMGVYSDVLDPDRLGGLSPEKRSARVTIKGPKDYVFKGRRTIKGIRKTAVQVGRNVYRQLMFPGIYSLLRDAPPGQFPVVTRDKVLKRIYKKGLPGGFGGLVRPFTL